MSDTFSPALQIRLPATGAYSNTWGSVLNSDALTLIDNAIAGLIQVNLGTSVVLNVPPLNAGSSSIARYFCVQFIGTPAAAVSVVLPPSVISKFYLIDNFDTGQTLTFSYVGSTNTVSVQPGEKHLIWCDGSNVWDCTAAPSTLLNGIASSNFARVSKTAAEVGLGTVLQNIYVGVNNVHPFNRITLPGGSSITLDPTFGDVQYVTLTGNYSIGVPVNALDGSAIELYVVQDGTGGRTLTWNSIFLFQGGAQPILSQIPGGVDKFMMRYNATFGKWVVEIALGITTPAGASYPLTISSNVQNFALLPLLGTLGGPVSVTITVNQGVIVSSASAVTAAMDLSGLPSGSTVTLVNNGYIIGCGGRGADGAMAVYNGTSPRQDSGGNAQIGGIAILGPGLSRTFNVSNSNGHIWGGGGGGGSGGANANGGGNGGANAGGGGGGAGGGLGGRGGRSVNQSTAPSPGIAPDGASGALGYGGAGGSPGVGTISTGGAGSVGLSGAGGNYGAAGTNGTDASLTTGSYGLPSNGAAAGKAVELQGASAPTIGGSVLGMVS